MLLQNCFKLKSKLPKKNLINFNSFAGLILVSSLFSCSTSPVKQTGTVVEKVENTFPDTLAAAVKKDPPGKKLFSENCENCHGADGRKKYNEAVDLSVSTLTVKERIQIISAAQVIGNKVNHPRWKTILTEKEISEVAEFLDLLRVKKENLSQH